jgi:signal transduction histidine kinase
MIALRRPSNMTGSLTRQFSILVAVAILSTQFVDLIVTQTLPSTMSGVTMGGVLVRLQHAVEAVEAVESAPADTAAAQLEPFNDRRLKFRLLSAAPPAVAPSNETLLRILRVSRLTFGGAPSDIRLIRLGPIREFHLPPPRSSLAAGVGDYPNTPPGVQVDPATFDILTLPGRPLAIAVKTSRGWVAVQDAEHGERIWLRRAVPDLAITILLILPIALWVGSRIGSRLKALAGAIEQSGSETEIPLAEQGGPRDVRIVVEAFNQMQARIRALLADRSMMMAAISHDVRTPLARMRFRIAELPSEIRAGVTADIEEIDELVDALLSLNRADGAPRRVEKFDLSALAQSMVDELADAGADIRFLGDDRAPMRGDFGSAKRILSNLIQNALKYASDTKVILSQLDGQVELAVEDQGPGVPAEMAEAIFEPFRRLDASRSRDSGGSGMGLAIARHLARKAGGELALDCGYQGGARFVLTLPSGFG